MFVFLFLICAGAAYAQAEVVPVQEVTSPGGVKAWLVQDDKLPLIAMSFAFRGGVEQDPEDKQGLAELASSLVTQGAGPYDAEAFQQKLADNSIQLGFSASRDALQGSLKTLRSTRGTAFHLLKLALTEARFDEEDFERARNQQLTAVKFSLGSANWQARNALFSDIFKDHPYSFRRLGSEASLARITREDVRDFVKKHFARDNLLVAVTGAISPAELSKVLDEVFGALPEGAELTPIPDVQEKRDPSLIVVQREGTQTDTLFAAPMLRRDDPDWFAAEIANYTLGGGGFSSRLMNAVRDKEGLTYGISTSLAPMDHASVLVGSVSTDNPKSGLAWDKVMEVWRGVYERGITEDDIDAAKDYLTGSLPLALTSTSSIADVLLGLQLERLGIDYLNRRNEMIRKVTFEDVQRVIKRWFDPTKITAVMVGEPEGVRPTRMEEQVRE